jgi:hypothetical protein
LLTNDGENRRSKFRISSWDVSSGIRVRRETRLQRLRRGKHCV